MATTSQALTELYNEVEGRIKALTPNDRVRARSPFAVYRAREDKTVTSFTGKSRIFDLGNAEPADRWHLGVSEQGCLYHIPIIIVYRRTREWMLAANDDCHQIYSDLLNNAPTPAIDGVSNRFCVTTQPAVEHNPDHAWDYYTLTLQAFLSVTAT